MASIAVASTPIPRKPPQPAQYNWLTGGYESAAEQLLLPGISEPETPLDVELPPGDTVQLLATESGSQLLVAGAGLSVGKKSERVTIRQNRKLCGELPLFRIQEIVLVGRGVSISTDLIEAACARGIRVGMVTGSGKPVALLTSPFLTATVETRRRQMAAYTEELGAEFVRWIVAGKLHNQEKLLRYFGKSREGEARERLETAANRIRGLRKLVLSAPGNTADETRPAALGYEGAGGRIYWESVARMLPAALGFRSRQHTKPQDGLNMALNYGYGILYTHVWGAVMNAGLEPFAGFVHGDKAGKPSLVLDLVEEFRQPVVDRPLLAWLTKGGHLSTERGLLDGESREAVATKVLQRLNATEPHRGKNHQVRSIIQMQARLAASAMQGRRPYRPFAFKW